MDEDVERPCRPDLSYRSLRQSSSRVFSQLKKKASLVESSVQSRRALRPLQHTDDDEEEEEEEGASKKARSEETVETARNNDCRELIEQGYEFDPESGLMRTPLFVPPTPALRPHSPHGFSRLRSSLRGVFSRVTSSKSIVEAPKKQKNIHESPTSSRAAKQLARCRIGIIQSPKRVSKTFENRLRSLYRGKDKKRQPLLMHEEEEE